MADELEFFRFKYPFNDNNNKYICMVNNSLYLLINETSYKAINSNYSINLDNINKYSINFHFDTGRGIFIYIITYIVNNQVYFYKYRLNLAIFESYLINKLIVNETNLSNDINCLVKDSYLKCAFYKKYEAKLCISSLNIETDFIYSNKTFELNRTLYGNYESIIKLSFNLNKNELFIGLFFIHFVSTIVYHLNEEKIKFKHFLNINKSELFFQNEVEIYSLDDNREGNKILLAFKKNSLQFAKVLIKNTNGSYERESFNYFSDNKESCNGYNNNFYFLEQKSEELIQECFDNSYCKIDNISNTDIISNQTEEKQNDHEHIFETEEEKVELNITKDKLLNEISKILKEIDTEKNYKIKGEDFTLLIYPITNSSFLNSTTHVDFSQCEEILRSSKNLSSSDIINMKKIFNYKRN
jgi:hypothetical protein